MRINELQSDYERHRQRWNTFWEKLMNHPESPKAAEWLEKFNEASAKISENLNLQIQLIEDAHVAE